MNLTLSTTEEKAVSGSSETSIWPLAQFLFRVTGMPNNPVFQEVIGLDPATEAIEYRGGNTSIYPPSKMPGLVKLARITLNKGVFVNDNDFRDWWRSATSNTTPRCTITVHLLNETGAEVCAWVLHNAFPAQVSGADLQSDSDKIEVETVELAYETMTIL